MDHKKGNQRGEIVELATNWSIMISSAGFEWVEGSVPWSDNAIENDIFLVEQPGEQRDVHLPDDLWELFYNLEASSDRVIRFANRFGCLRFPSGAQHFHGGENLHPLRGESRMFWLEQLELFKCTVNLWYAVIEHNPREVIEQLRAVGAPFPEGTPFRHVGRMRFPEAWRTSDPIRYATETVVRTVNLAIAGGGGHKNGPKCAIPECGERLIWDDFNLTRPRLEIKPRTINLAVVSGSLLKVIWMQFAGVVSGMRKLKPCEAPDCKLRGWIDVTNSPRPGKLKYHKACKERLKKQRRNERNRTR